ncbi:hypothetical protein B0H66DRAFT_124960 [Apodospora peruviana]|uniref:Uncharacterized protein n=1 Tax=Apodospora peruviana TaxID=516989 RepID=A0AAE0IHU3_9PEZI|nr:hypothetical protein B0H66DRAFT_124960 [Apodospora peruviana]
MASTTVVCSKKSTMSSLKIRHFDRQEASQRQASENAPSAPCQPKRSSDLPFDAKSTVRPHNPSSDYQSSIDEMANALLDDTTDVAGCGVGPQNIGRPAPDNPPLPENLSYPQVVHDHPLTQHEEEYEDEEDQLVTSRKTRPTPASCYRFSPTAPRRSSKRHRRVSTRQPRMSPKSSGGVGPVRNLPKSTTGALNPLRMNPTKLSSSSSMPLTKLMGTTGACPPSASNEQTMDCNQISQKIEMMLAATEALKPQSKVSIPSSSTTSKVPRAGKKQSLLKKVSNAFTDRFLAKGSKGKEVEKEMEKDNGSDNGKDVQAQLSNILPPIPLADQTSPITAIEMRLNEGKNLNKGKVQKMVGGYIQRKPLPGGGNSLRQHISPEDPFSESSDSKRPPTEFENRLRANSVDDSVIQRLPDQNPFESEGIMESSLDSILDTAPVASSTPRARPAHIRLASECSIQHLRNRSGGLSYGIRPAAMISDPNIPLEREPQKHWTEPMGRDTGDCMEGVHHQHPRPKPSRALSYIPVVENWQMKKHPSPAKQDLDLMMKEFSQKYPNMVGRPAASHDETDELAYSSYSSPDSYHSGFSDGKPLISDKGLWEGNKNFNRQSRKQHGPVNRASVQGKPVRKATLMAVAGLRPSQTEVQLGHPEFAHHMAVDELQMDPPVTKHGYTSPLGSLEFF